MAKYDLIIGIDPGYKTCGFAIVDKDQCILKLTVTSAADALNEVLALECSEPKLGILVVIEDPSKNKPFFYKRYYAAETERERIKIAQDVGSNKGIGKLIIDYLKSFADVKVKTVHPKIPKKDKLAIIENYFIGKIATKNQNAIDALYLTIGW